MDYLYIDISPNYVQFVKDRREEEMGGVITDNDKVKFSKK